MSGKQDDRDLEERVSALEEEMERLKALAKRIFERVSQ